MNKKAGRKERVKATGRENTAVRAREIVGREKQGGM